MTARTHYEAMAREAAAPADGGQAFPGEKSMRFGQTNDCNEGMTLRDYFAAKAMQALINAKGEPIDRLDEVPEYAYQIADAMIAARARIAGGPSHG